MQRKQHWENVYANKRFEEVSWFQEVPVHSLHFINQLHLQPDAAIIDVGAGESKLAEQFIQQGFTDLTVLDISATAIEKAKQNLAAKADKVKWIVADITKFEPRQQYDCWHDRAVFHFLTEQNDIDTYLSVLDKAIKPGGQLIVGTFADNGPEKCSGLPVKRYSEQELVSTFSPFFEKIACEAVAHVTPSGSVQHFIFCTFNKKKNGLS